MNLIIMYNVVEDIVKEYLDLVLDRNADACRCKKCRADMVAYALNRLKPRYVVSEKGAVLARTQSLDSDFQTEILVVLTAAVKQVAAHPRHEQE